MYINVKMFRLVILSRGEEDFGSLGTIPAVNTGGVLTLTLGDKHGGLILLLSLALSLSLSLWHDHSPAHLLALKGLFW